MASAAQATAAMPGGGTTGGSTVQPVVPWTGPSWAAGLHSKLHDFVKKALLKQLMFRGASVCDLFCGRGMDIAKWAQAETGQYIGVDLSASALEDAREEWAQCGKPFPAHFCELDPCMSDLRARLEGHGLPADLVCCLGHLQDCFENEDMVKSLLRNVATLLKPGAFFLGITPDSSTIWYKYQKAVEGAIKTGSLRVNGALPRVRSELYSISFEDDRFNFYGTKYQLRFADDGLPPQSQLLVHFPSLIRLAEEVGLECVEIQNLFDFYEDFRNPFAEALRSSCGTLLDAKGRLPTQAHEILMLYTTFIFKRVDPDAEVSSKPSAIFEDLEPQSFNVKDHVVVRRRESGCSTEVTEPPSKKPKPEITPGIGNKQDLQIFLDMPESDGVTSGSRHIGQRNVQALDKSISQVHHVEVENMSPRRIHSFDGTPCHSKEPKQLAEVDALAGCKSRYEMGRPFPVLNASLGVEVGQSHNQEEVLDPAASSTVQDVQADSTAGKRLEDVQQYDPIGKRQKIVVFGGQELTEERKLRNLELSSPQLLSEPAVLVPLFNDYSNQLKHESSRPKLQIDGTDPCIVGDSIVQNKKQGVHELTPSQLDSTTKDSGHGVGSDSNHLAGRSAPRQDESGGNSFCKEQTLSIYLGLEEAFKVSVTECGDPVVDENERKLVLDEAGKKLGRGGIRKRWEPIADSVVNLVQKGEFDTDHGSQGWIVGRTSAVLESVISSNVTCLGKAGASGKGHDLTEVIGGEVVALCSTNVMEPDSGQQKPPGENRLEKSKNDLAGSGFMDQKPCQTGKVIDLTRRAEREKGPSEPPGLSSSLSNFTRGSQQRGGSWRSGGKSTNSDEASRKAHGRSGSSRGQRQQQETGGLRPDEDQFGHQRGAGSVRNEQLDSEMFRRSQVAAFGYATGEGLAAAVAVATAAARHSLPPEPGYAFFTPSIYPLLPTRAHNLQEIQLAAPSPGILGPGPRPPPTPFARLHGHPPIRQQAIVDQQLWQSHQDRRLTGVCPVGRFHRDEWGGQHDSFRTRTTPRGLTPKFDSRNASLVGPIDDYAISAQSGSSRLPVEALRSHGPADNWLEVNPSVPPRT